MNLAQNLEFWMTNLPEKLTTIPIIHLAIPGSHDSTTYAINNKSDISPDARNPIQYLKCFQAILRPIIIKWSRTQSVDVTEQLKGGIRYFDLRVALKDDAFYFVHNLYCDSVAPVLEQINHFLNRHPNEVVILDFQHFYKMTSYDHRRLFSILNLFFGDKILPFCVILSEITLKHIRDSHFQVIIIYRADEAIVEEALWPSTSFPTPWPDTTDITQLIDFLNASLITRDFSNGFVSQCVLTPTVWFAFKNLFGSLKSKCFLPLESEKYGWLSHQQPGLGGVNIVICDFVEHEDYKFSKEIINLNRKFLTSLEDRNYDRRTED